MSIHMRNLIHTPRAQQLRLVLSRVFALIAVTPLAMPAQVTPGSILGTVYDATGGVLPNSTVTATNLNTGITRKALSNGSGDYVLPYLQPGSHKLAAASAGFNGSGIQLEVAFGHAANFDFHLKPAGVSQSIEVDGAGAATALETNSHRVGAVVPGQSIENPNGRTVFQTLQSSTNVSRFRRATKRLLPFSSI
jgi:trimeric autotransporter adhesin